MEQKIDLVYLWVDGNDEDWLKKKNSYLKEFSGELDNASINNCRFHNNDELKYSLRSVEKYANWINKIFIVTDNQIPSWLNTENSRIKIVNHSEIIPEDKLPLFNSCAIESRIPFIKDLSEYFLYANDDTFFWNNVEPDFFFKNNKVIVRIEKFFKKSRKYNSLYGQSILSTFKLFSKKYDSKYYAYYPHHNIDAYKKSLFMDCINNFKEYFNITLSHRFRTPTDVQRIIISLFSLYQDEAILKITKRNFLQKLLNTKNDSAIYSLKGKHIPKLINSNTKLMCINDNQRTTNNDRLELKKILEKKFNSKSEFEK